MKKLLKMIFRFYFPKREPLRIIHSTPPPPPVKETSDYTDDNPLEIGHPI